MFRNSILKTSAIVCGVMVIGLLANLTPAAAQLSPPPGGVKRTILQKVDVPGTNFEMVLAIAEIPAKAAAGRHTHFGPETATVLEGDLVLKVDGQPDKTVKVGESYQVPGGTVHDAIMGDKPVKIIVSYAIEKGKPLATPAPAK